LFRNYRNRSFRRLLSARNSGVRRNRENRRASAVTRIGRNKNGSRMKRTALGIPGIPRFLLPGGGVAAHILSQLSVPREETPPPGVLPTHTGRARCSSFNVRLVFENHGNRRVSYSRFSITSVRNDRRSLAPPFA